MEKSTFMRSYYRSVYEDPLWNLVHRKAECEDIYNERSAEQKAFRTALKEEKPELCEMYDNLIDTIYRFETVLFEEFYILGVQDREESLVRQE